MAAQVYRPDLYKKAAESLVAVGIIKAAEFPDFATEDGFRDPQTHFIDGIVYDGTKPNDYINKFAIGLKQGQTL